MPRWGRCAKDLLKTRQPENGVQFGQVRQVELVQNTKRRQHGHGLRVLELDREHLQVRQARQCMVEVHVALVVGVVVHGRCEHLRSKRRRHGKTGERAVLGVLPDSVVKTGGLHDGSRHTTQVMTGPWEANHFML